MFDKTTIVLRNYNLQKQNAMATKTYSVPNFTKGLFMSWGMYTQAAFKISVTLKDSAKTYVNASRANTNIDPPLSLSNSTIAGNNMQITVDIPQSSNIKASINSYNITRDDGTPVGYGFNLSVEDSNDDDYNDLYVTMVAWISKG